MALTKPKEYLRDIALTLALFGLLLGVPIGFTWMLGGAGSPNRELVEQYPSPGFGYCAVVVDCGGFLSRGWYEIYLYAHACDSSTEEWAANGDGNEVGWSYAPPTVVWDGPLKLLYVGGNDPEVNEWSPWYRFGFGDPVTIERVEKIE